MKAKINNLVARYKVEIARIKNDPNRSIEQTMLERIIQDLTDLRVKS